MLVGLTISLGHYNNYSASIMTFLSPFSLSILWPPSGMSFTLVNIFHPQVLAWFLAQQFSILAAHWGYLWNPSPTSWVSMPRIGLGLLAKYLKIKQNKKLKPNPQIVQVILMRLTAGAFNKGQVNVSVPWARWFCLWNASCSMQFHF